MTVTKVCYEMRQYVFELISEINECDVGLDNCGVNASCANTDGSFTCSCDTGYSGDGINCSGKCNRNDKIDIW